MRSSTELTFKVKKSGSNLTLPLKNKNSLRKTSGYFAILFSVFLQFVVIHFGKNPDC